MLLCRNGDEIGDERRFFLGGNREPQEEEKVISVAVAEVIKWREVAGQVRRRRRRSRKRRRQQEIK